MSRSSASAGRRKGGVEQFSSVVSEIAGELRDLSSRVEKLGEAIAALDPDSTTTEKPPKRAVRGSKARFPLEEFRVTVRPLPELAMAAVAETSLRALPSVRQVLSVERTDDWASFLLEVSTGADLVSEMRTVMPVGFNVTDSKPDEMSLELKWLWGTDSV
ncbi:MAG: hypothetical protein WEB05_01035 [Solirubrobacterales bacterium]